MNSFVSKLIVMLNLVFLISQVYSQDIWDDPDLKATSTSEETSAPPASAAKPVPATPQPKAPQLQESPLMTEQNPAPESVKAPTPESILANDQKLQNEAEQAKMQIKASLGADTSKTPENPAVEAAQPAIDSSVTASSVSAADSTTLPSDSLNSTFASDSSAIDSLAQAGLTTDSAGVDTMSAKTEPLTPLLPVTAVIDTPTVIRDSIALKMSIEDSIRNARRAKILGNVKISKIHTQSDMGSKYRSPKTALFASLIIPGAGQAYVGSSNWTYARGAVYFLAELALGYGFYNTTIKEFDQKSSAAQKFLESHYDIQKYDEETFQARSTAVGQSSENDASTEFDNRYLSSRESFCDNVFSVSRATALENCKTISSNPISVSWDDVRNKDELAILLERDAYVLGWDDAIQTTQPLELDNKTAYVELGTSANLKKYRSKKSDARKLADMQSIYLTGFLLNHIVSAIDAAWSAHSHNQSQVKSDLSWYHQVRLQSAWAPVVDKGASWQGFVQAQLSF